VTNNFAQSPLQAHQWISHKHVKVNNVIVNHPKYMLIPGDVIELDYLAISKNKNWGSRLSATTVSCQRDDEGKTWASTRYLEDHPSGSYHYPAIIQTHNGRLHAIYSYFVEGGKSMKHVEFNEAWIEQKQSN
jgi:ribosomal protein S4